MVKRSKKYREASEKIDRNNLYTANEAIALVKSMPEYKFDQTVEAVLRLNVDPRKADQLVRGSVNLPNGTGKTAKVLVFARGPKATEALEAGADIVGDDDLVQKVADGFLTSIPWWLPRTWWARSAASAACSVRVASCRTRRPAP